MLKILDRYLMRKYLSTFLFTCLVFSLIAIIIDFSEKVEEFIDEHLSAQQVIFEYYINFIIYINGILWPLFALIAVIFFTSRLAYNSEIIASLAAGISFRRLMVPYALSAALIAGVHLLANHYFIPYGNKSRVTFEHKYIWKESDHGKTRDVHLFIGPETKVYVRYYSKPDSAARNIRIERFQDGSLVELLRADRAEWQGPPNRWKLRNYEIRRFRGLHEEIVIGRGQEIDTAFNLTPRDFVWYANEKEMLTTPELKAHIAREQQRGVVNTRIYEVELYRRTADPFTIIILTFIGMPLAARKVRGGMGLHLALGVGIGAIFIFLSRFTITFAMNETMPPLLGVWLPNIIFGGIAAYLVRKAQK